MPELDTLRGLAILGVLLYHGLYWARDLSPFSPIQRRILSVASVGQFGVNLFFVLSGFLITGLLLDSKNRPDYYRRFYLRRALRILPAYYLTLAVLVFFHLISHGFLVMSLLYSSNLSLLFGIAMSYPVLWAVAVEQHFYIFWPVVVKRLSERALMGVTVAILILTPFSRLFYHLHAARLNEPRPGFDYYTWNVADSLAMGAFVCLWIRLRNSNREKVFGFSLTLLASGIALAIGGWPNGVLTRRTPFGDAFQRVSSNLCFAALLGFFLLAGSGKWKDYVRPRLLLFFGRISYGLFLFQLMFFILYNWLARRTWFEHGWNLDAWARTWIALAFAGTTSTLAAYLSRNYFEQHFLDLKDLLSKPRGSSGGISGRGNNS